MNKFNTLIAVFVIASMMSLTSCVTQIGALSMASSKTNSLQYKDGAKYPAQVVGQGKSIEVAISKALALAGPEYDAMIDCRVDAIEHYIVIAEWYTYRVTGTAVKTSMLKN